MNKTDILRFKTKNVKKRGEEDEEREGEEGT